MELILGIDTGGTYTDSVIFDKENDKVLAVNKTLTKKENLLQSILNAVDVYSDEYLKNIKGINLSTTLATNACVEYRQSNVLLILLGCDEKVFKSYSHEYGLKNDVATVFLKAAHNQQGSVAYEINENEIEQLARENADKYDAFAIVELWGIRNAEYEYLTAEIFRKYTKKSVVCAVEVTSEINSLKRAASVYINAGLINLMQNFIKAVKDGLSQKGVDVPVMIVRSDGSLMSEDFASEKPVETLFSGPSASITGGLWLSNCQNCVVVDIGGTTTDVAVITDGLPGISENGISIGSWRTGNNSIQASTIGLGGDSLIALDNKNVMSVGPNRVMPVSRLIFEYPELLDDLAEITEQRRIHTRNLCQFFSLVEINNTINYTEQEKKILNALRNAPKSILKLAEMIGESIYTLRIERLESLGIVLRSSLTPTDIMHIKGDFSVWNTKAAEIAAENMALQLDLTTDDLCEKVYKLFKFKLYDVVVKSLSADKQNKQKNVNLQITDENIIQNGFIDSEKEGKYNNILKTTFSTDYSIVGVGAPSHIFLPEIAEKLGTKYINCEYFEVANAIGTVTGNITGIEKVLIKPIYKASGIDGYNCFSTEKVQKINDYDEAITYAKLQSRKLALSKAHEMGADNVNIITEVVSNNVNINKKTEENEYAESGFLLEVTVVSRAIGVRNK